MSLRDAPRVLSIPAGAPFLPTLVDALFDGRLVPEFELAGNPLALADVTIYVPTRRAARSLRGLIATHLGGVSAVLPRVLPLGELDEDELLLGPEADAIDLDPPIGAEERTLLLAPLVRQWKRRLPQHIGALFEEAVVVPASSADAIWLARDLGALIDEIETEGADATRLSGLVPDDLARWWQVTLDFLRIVTEFWPAVLRERGRGDPAAHRNALLRREADRLRRNPPAGPVIAAGSTGSIPATAELLSVIARLPQGALVLPGLDLASDDAPFAALLAPDAPPATLGHPQYGLARLLQALRVARRDVEPLAEAPPALALRGRLVSEALRPAAETDAWPALRGELDPGAVEDALSGVTLVEAANEREEATAIALALRRAVAEPGRRAALVTVDRDLARRVAAELSRWGIAADDSGGHPLSGTAPATLFGLMLRAALLPGDPVPIAALLGHPLLRLGRERPALRRAAATLELVALRGGTGRPDIAMLPDAFEARLTTLAAGREPFWLSRLAAQEIEAARALATDLEAAVAPLAAMRLAGEADIALFARASVESFERLGRAPDGDLAGLYAGEAGDSLATLLRGLVGSDAGFMVQPHEWPDVAAALVAPVTVKPRQGLDRRVAIWGALEARLQSVDTVVLGGLNEGSWPRRAEADRFMSRLMKAGLDLPPPERRIGQSAHDFEMAMGMPEVILTRASRTGNAPSTPSRWLQRLATFAGERTTATMRARGALLLHWTRGLDAGAKADFALRPRPTPPLEARPKRFSVTEIETLRRDPYAIYARRILRLEALEPFLRDPGAAERGTLFHAILHRFTTTIGDAARPDAADLLVAIGAECFAGEGLPEDVHAVWWPRFLRMVPEIVEWERGRAVAVAERHAEVSATPLAVGATDVVLSGRADRIDVLAGGMADILDYKTGSSPSRRQANRLLSPQLALEAALMSRGAFAAIGQREPADLVYVRLRANGAVEDESILRLDRSTVVPAPDLAAEAWTRLEQLLAFYGDPEAGYLSRALPFRQNETDGDYDHLARVLEWSSGVDVPGEGES